MPARSVLMSGEHNRTCTGGSGNVTLTGPDGRWFFPQYPEPGRPHLKDPTLAELLREQGYETTAIGKWHIHSWLHEVGFDMYYLPFEGDNHRLAGSPSQFFDVARDPCQLCNLAEKDSLPSPALELDERLRCWSDQTPWMKAE